MIGSKPGIRQWKMLYVSFLAVVLILLIVLSVTLWLLWKNQTALWSLTKNMMAEIQRQNNLLASKDLTTFSTLQTLNNSPVGQSTMVPFIPQDDESVAKLIAQKYVDAGIDPASAYDSPDDALGELGLKDHGF